MFVCHEEFEITQIFGLRLNHRDPTRTLRQTQRLHEGPRRGSTRWCVSDRCGSVDPKQKLFQTDKENLV